MAIAIIIAIIWVVVIIVAIKAFRMTPEQLRDHMDVPRSDRDANKPVDVHGKEKEHAVEASQQSRGKHSTRNIVIITTIVVIAIVIIGNLSKQSSETIPSQPTQPDIPRYTADQVIAVVRAKYPIAINRNLVMTPTEISVSYVGGTNRAWRATIKAPDGYYWTEHFEDKTYVVTQTVEYFWETDGSLHSLSWESPDIFK